MKRAVLGLTLVLLSLAPAGQAGAAEEPTLVVGWWTRSPGQQAPDGGFAVAAAPDGPVTVAAVRVDLGEGVRSAELTASEAGGLGQDLAGLQVCPTTESWEPVAGGALADAPAASCDAGSAPFERDAAAGDWRVDLSSLVTGQSGQVSFVVLPGPAPEGGLPTTLGYDVQLAAPVLEAPPAAGPSTSTAGESATAEQSTPASSPSSDATASSGSTVSPSAPVVSGSTAGTFESAPQPLALSDPAEEVAAPAAAAPTGAPDPASGQSQQASAGFPRVADEDGSGTPWGKGVAYVVASALVAVAAAGGRRLFRARLATA